MKLLDPDSWSAYQGAFIGLWTDSTHAYALYEPGELVAVLLQDGAYPALPYPGADWFQRLAKDLNGHIAVGFEAEGTAIEQFRAPDGRAAWPAFNGPDDEGVHQFALGPVYGDITEPAHFRIFVLGESVLKLQTRLGYAHRGILELLRGKSPRQAARYAARITGDSTIAHSIAFARAAEAALGVEAPARAHFLRGLMAEIERLANHFGDLGEIAEITRFMPLAARCAGLREVLADVASMVFGHRLMMDIVVPGGVTKDIDEGGADMLQDMLATIERELVSVHRIFETTASLKDRLVGIGIIPPALAASYNAAGYVGRGSGQVHDARKSPGYPPYTGLEMPVPVEQAGDIDARVKVRLAEMVASISLIRQFLSALPDGPVALAMPAASGAGLAVAESFRGPVWHWLKIENGQIQDGFMIDASATHWALLAMAAPASILADLPLIERSINPSAAAVDG